MGYHNKASLYLEIATIKVNHGDWLMHVWKPILPINKNNVNCKSI